MKDNLLLSLFFGLLILLASGCQKDEEALIEEAEEQEGLDYSVPETSLEPLMFYWECKSRYPSDIDKKDFDLRSTTNPKIGDETFYCYIAYIGAASNATEEAGHIYFFKTENDYKKFIEENRDWEYAVIYTFEFDFNINYFSWNNVRFTNEEYDSYFCSKD